MPDKDPPSYSPPTYDEYAHRESHPIKDVSVSRQRVQEIVKDLLDLEAQTHPQNPSSDRKELDSIWALVLAGELVEKLAGWAIDHRAGIVANGVTGFPWPEGDTKAASAANDHRNEEEGSRYLKDRETRDPACNRAILSDIVERSPVLPSALHLELSRALDALRFGEAYDLLRPTKGLGEKAATLWSLRFDAIRHLHYFMGRDRMNRREAVKRVADAYGIIIRSDDHLLKDWEYKSLKRYFGGKKRVQAVLQHAERLGHAVFKTTTKVNKTKVDERFVQTNDLVLGELALRENGRRFQEMSPKGKN